MTTILEGGLAAELCERLSDVFIAAKVTRTTVEGGTPWDPSGGVTTVVDYDCLACIDAYRDQDVDGTRIAAGDAKVTVLTPTLAIIPDASTDTVTIRGVTYTIISIASDPAQATWTIQGRR